MRLRINPREQALLFPLNGWRVSQHRSRFHVGWCMASVLLLAGLKSNVVAESSLVPFFGPYAVWFPPLVPVSGEPIPDASRVTRENARLEPPEGLADFVNESFFPALSTRLQTRSLTSEMRRRLDGYRGRRSSLFNELADQLVASHGTDDETRRTELQKFATQHSPRIVELEREAEDLRRTLIDGGLLHLSVDWSRKRRWRIGVTRFAGEHAAKEAEFQVVRAAAFYQDGLTIEQRGLLMEVALELRDRARAARPVPAKKSGDPAAMFFSPAMARMRLPRNAPPDLVALIGRYNRDKTALKQELREAVFDQDEKPADERTRAFAALADEQWPRLVELE